MSEVGLSTKQKTLRTAERALTVLEILNHSKDLTTSEIARESRLSRATAFRILGTLINTGYIKRDPTSKTYHLTDRVLNLSVGYSLKETLIDIATPVIEQASRNLIWPLLMARPKGMDMEVLVSTDYDNPFAIRRSKPGHRRHISKTASGRAFIAFANASIQSQYFSLLSENGLDKEAFESFKADIRLTAKQGYALYQQEGAPESSIAVPIVRDDRVVATLSGRYVTRAMTHASVIGEIIPVLQRTAKCIADMLASKDLRAGCVSMAF